MVVKTEARILIFSGTDIHFPSTFVPPGTFLGSGSRNNVSKAISKLFGTEKNAVPSTQQ